MGVWGSHAWATYQISHTSQPVRRNYEVRTSQRICDANFWLDLVVKWISKSQSYFKTQLDDMLWFIVKSEEKLALKLKYLWWYYCWIAEYTLSKRHICEFLTSRSQSHRPDFGRSSCGRQANSTLAWSRHLVCSKPALGLWGASTGWPQTDGPQGANSAGASIAAKCLSVWLWSGQLCQAGRLSVSSGVNIAGC